MNLDIYSGPIILLLIMGFIASIFKIIGDKQTKKIKKDLEEVKRLFENITFEEDIYF